MTKLQSDNEDNITEILSYLDNESSIDLQAKQYMYTLINNDKLFNKATFQFSKLERSLDFDSITNKLKYWFL